MFFEKMCDDWKASLKTALESVLGTSVDEPTRTLPPSEKLGDIAFPLFPYAKIGKRSPVKIAQELCDYFSTNEHPDGEYSQAGGYFFPSQHLPLLYALFPDL